jgi:adenosine deaminase CECR1
MPKGGALHLHTLSTGDAEWLVNRVLCEDNSYIYLSDDGQVLKGKLGIFKNGEVPPGYQSMKEMHNTHKEFKEWVIQMITMTSQDTTQKNPWEKFEACFERIWHLLNYEPLFRDFYQNALEILAEDHVQIVELRAGVYELYDLEGTKYSLEDTLRIYLEILEEVRKKHPHLHLKLILSNNRKNDVAQECIDLERAYRLRAQFPQLVKGYDLVGFETTGHTTLYYIQELLVEAKQLQKKYNALLPYFFHDGESDWITDTNIFDAVLLKSKRIGHGFNLFYFPGLVERVKKQRICIEICPISNQILGYAKDLRISPGVTYLKRGIDIVISSDDPMLFRTRGLSYDFWEAIVAWDLSLADIKQLCINSIMFSTLCDTEKQDAMKIWE